MKHSLNPRWERHRVFKRQKKTEFFSTFTSCNVNDHISSNLGRGQSRYHFKNCGGKNILHINKQLETTFSGKRLNLEEMPKTSPINQTHVLIQASTLFMVVAAGTAALKMISEGLLSMVLSIRGTGKLKIRVQKLYPNFWRKWPTSIPYLWLKRLKNNTLRTCAYLHSSYKGVSPGGGGDEVVRDRLVSLEEWRDLQLVSVTVLFPRDIHRNSDWTKRSKTQKKQLVW